MISKIDRDKLRFILGEDVQARQEGQVLAINKDSYPAAVVAPGGRVVYCAFDSLYSRPLRGFIEGVTREVLKIPQKVRLLRDGLVEPGLMTSIRQDYKDADRRYLMVINLLPHPRRVTVELEEGWRVEKEYFHALAIDREAGVPGVLIAPREVYLFEIVKR
jgi:hypothetical protein